jgi:sulfate transport system ATP-binding protein
MSITLEGVTKRFRGTTIVDDVTLDVAEGELYVLLGESGSGKSTLLRLIAGLTSLDAGQIRLRGRDVTALPPQQRGTGFVFQNYSLFQHMTVAQNIEFGLKIRKTPPDQRQRVQDKLLEMVGLAGLGDRYPAQLSGGQQQRVALARALAYQPDVLLLDEPFGALDAKTRSYLRRELRRIQKELGVTTIFVTHDREDAFELADRIGILLRGRLVANGSPQVLYHEPATPYVASLLGDANLLLAQVHEAVLSVGELRLPVAKAAIAVEKGRQALVYFRPEDVDVTDDETEVQGEPLGSVRATDFSFAGRYLKVWLELAMAVRKPTPSSVAEEESARAIVAMLPSEKSSLLKAKQLWAGLKQYRVLPGEPIRAVAVVPAGERGRQVLDAARILANAEAIEVQVLMRGELELVTDWDAYMQRITTEKHEANGGRGVGAILRGIGPDLPDILLLDRPEALSLLQGMTPTLDARFRRDGTAMIVIPPGELQLQRILVATGAGAPGREDVRFAARLARRVQGEVILLHVVADLRLPLDLDELVARGMPQAVHLKRDKKFLEMLGIRAQIVLRQGAPRREILREVEASRVGMLVIGGYFPPPSAWRPESNLTRRISESNPGATAIVYGRVL